MILGGMSDNVKIVPYDFEKDVKLKDVNRCPTAYNRMLGVNSKIISEVMHSRRKRSKGKPGIHKRKRSPSKYERNEVLVPYVPLNMYVHQPESEYEVLVAEPENDPKIDLRPIFSYIDNKFSEKVDKKVKLKNSIFNKWLKILEKKKKALFWLWDKKFSRRGYEEGIVYAEQMSKHFKTAKRKNYYRTHYPTSQTLHQHPKPPPPSSIPKLSRKKLFRKYNGKKFHL